MNQPDPRKALDAAVDLRFDVVEFLTSRVGAYLWERAHVERQDALEQLAQVAPHDTSKVMALQQKVRVRDDFARWLREAVTSGDAAAAQLEQLDHDDQA